MPRRDLIRNIVIVGVLVLALILLRIFVFHPLTITEKMANASVKNGDLVVATRNAQVDRSDLVLYKVGGKEHLGRVIAKEDDEVSYVDDVLYLNGQATPEPYLNNMLNKHLAAPTSNGSSSLSSRLKCFVYHFLYLLKSNSNIAISTNNRMKMIQK